MATELWQRLRALRRHFGITQQQAGDATCVDRAAVSQWEAADPSKRTTPDWQKLKKLADHVGLPLEWLTSDESDTSELAMSKLAPSNTTNPDKVRQLRAYAIKTDEDVSDDGDVTVEVADIELSAGTGRQPHEFVETLYRHTYRAEWLRNVGVRDPRTIKRCRVYGDSMERTLFHGDMATFDTANLRLVENGVYALHVSDQLKVKRLRRRRDGGLLIVSDNQLYAIEEVPPDELDTVTILGRVIDRSGRGGLEL